MLLILILLLFLHSSFAKCPEGAIAVNDIYGGDWSCILFNSSDSQFLTAEEECMDKGGHLVSVPNTIINFFIAQEANLAFGVGNSGLKFWIGVTALLGNGWRNIDNGSQTIFFDWATGEPNNSTARSGCVAMDVLGNWYNTDCFDSLRYVCELVKKNTSSTAPVLTAKETTKLTSTSVAHNGSKASLAISDSYLSCENWILFSADTSQALPSQAFQNQLAFIANNVHHVKHPKMLNYNGGSEIIVSWMNNLSIRQIQDQIFATRQDSSQPFNLRSILSKILASIEGITLPTSTPIEVIVFITDTSSDSISGADEYAMQLKNNGVKLTFILMGLNVDQSTLTNLTTNFIPWTDLSAATPDNWENAYLGTYGC